MRSCLFGKRERESLCCVCVCVCLIFFIIGDSVDAFPFIFRRTFFFLRVYSKPFYISTDVFQSFSRIVKDFLIRFEIFLI